MELIVCGIMFVIVSLFASVCCIPPLLQAIEHKHKPSIYFSIACMVIMLSIAVTMIYKMCVGFPQRFPDRNCLDVLRLNSQKKFFKKVLTNRKQYGIISYTKRKERYVTMAKTKKQLHEELRADYLAKLVEYLTEKGEEVLQTGSQEVAIPCVDSEGNDEYIVITIKVPTGSRDGEAYDGYAVAEEYRLRVEKQRETAERLKAEKERKIARDQAMREQKAKAKAEREAAKIEG